VPLHWSRLIARRYNQAALIGNALARLTDAESVPDLLVRHRRTPSQGHLSRAERHRNVAGAFSVRPSRLARLRGRRVVLVDDVLTTGATVDACAAVLRRAGAASVDVLALARVVRPEP
jgi:ComF family protein